MNDIKLTSQELEFIEKLHKEIIQKWRLENDLKMLLWDWIQALKVNLFFASISVLTVFLEKYLRDTLIWYEVMETKWNINHDKFFEHVEAIEEKLEDGRNDKNEKYMFPAICNQLVKYWKIEEHISVQLQEIYKNIRVPVQHGIYGRIVRKNIWRYEVPVNKIVFPENPTVESLDTWLENAFNAPMNDTMNIQNPMLRMFIIPEYFKQNSLFLLKTISELVEFINGPNTDI